jgi:phosphatidylinositol 4-kinase
VAEAAKPEEPQQPSTELAVVPVDVTKGAKSEITLCSIFGESWKDKENRIRKESPYSHLPNWKLAAVIVKSGDDLRQEQLASQLLTHFKEIFENGLLPLFLYPLRILVTSADSGLIELIPDSISLHQLKKRTNCMSLAQYFKTVYTTQETLDKARLNFVESMAAYSLACYFLQVKDRHNGNIMIDSEGHVIHIDYGFFIFNSPGSLNFESAPFKLTPEFVEVMGGTDSKLYAYFKDLVFRGFMEARKYHEKILLILEMWLINSKYNTSVLPCLAGGKPAVDALAERFRMGYTEKECRDYIDSLIQSALGSWRTREYDRFQFLTRGVLYSS